MTQYKKNDALKIFDSIAAPAVPTANSLETFAASFDEELRVALVRDVVEILLGKEALDDFGIRRRD